MIKVPHYQQLLLKLGMFELFFGQCAPLLRSYHSRYRCLDGTILTQRWHALANSKHPSIKIDTICFSLIVQKSRDFPNFFVVVLCMQPCRACAGLYYHILRCSSVDKLDYVHRVDKVILVSHMQQSTSNRLLGARLKEFDWLVSRWKCKNHLQNRTMTLSGHKKYSVRFE